MITSNYFVKHPTLVESEIGTKNTTCTVLCTGAPELILDDAWSTVCQASKRWRSTRLCYVLYVQDINTVPAEMPETFRNCDAVFGACEELVLRTGEGQLSVRAV